MPMADQHSQLELPFRHSCESIASHAKVQPHTLGLSWRMLLVVAVVNWCCVVNPCAAQPTYSNVTLKSHSPEGDLSVVVYLPKGVKPNERTYYSSTRFDHSSMIGRMVRTKRDAETGKVLTQHVLYDTDQWRVPHDPYWPESGVGLASEFGVGDDGAFCNYRCGWYGINEVTNGVLGYQEAKNGEAFLKIGVGALVKGSCPTCDSTDDFKFNSPYEFASTPEWKLTEDPSTNSITLEHQAMLNQYGYQLKREVQLVDDTLLVHTTLTNLGRVPFSTAWYSHHLFTCDAHPVGHGLGVDLDVGGTKGHYEEPGTFFWSTPLQEYATLTSTVSPSAASSSSEPKMQDVSVEMNRGLDRNVRIKAEFTKDETSHGSFTIHGCETSITESIPEVGQDGSGISMYGFNLYIESQTFSPEPMILLHLFPGQSTSWTQRLDFADYDESNGASKKEMESLSSATPLLRSYNKFQASLGTPNSSTATSMNERRRLQFGAAFVLLSLACFGLCLHLVRKNQRDKPNSWQSAPVATYIQRFRRQATKDQYDPIPDAIAFSNDETTPSHTTTKTTASTAARPTIEKKHFQHSSSSITSTSTHSVHS